jgi:hypothetical protein
MMQLISQASPNIVPAAMLPIARPWMEAWCSYGSDSIRCIKFPSQYCYCCFLCYWSQPTEYWHQNFIFGTLLLMLSITKQVVLNMDQKWYISGYWHGGEYGGVHSAHRDISKCEWNFVFPCDTKYFDACSAVCRRYVVFILFNIGFSWIVILLYTKTFFGWWTVIEITFRLLSWSLTSILQTFGYIFMVAIISVGEVVQQTDYQVACSKSPVLLREKI